MMDNSESAKKILNYYAEGVNAYIEEAKRDKKTFI